MDKKLNNFIEQLEAKELDAHMLIGTLDVLVNNFSLNKEEVVDTLLTLSGPAERRFNDVSASCVWALGNAEYTDGRNEIAAGICKSLCKGIMGDALPEVGREFMSMHPTLQQTAMSVFFQYLDERAKQENYLGEIVLEQAEKLKSERGEKWYTLPLI